MKKIKDSYTPDAIKDALRKVTNGDRPSSARLARIASLPESFISRAVRRLTLASQQRSIFVAATTPDTRGTRSKDGKRAQRGGGVSRTHLMIVATVEDKTERQRLFNLPLKDCWSVAKLRAEVTLFNADYAVSRPLGLAYAVTQAATSLKVAIDKINGSDIVSAISGTKMSDRAAAIEECDRASILLRQIQSDIGNVSAVLLEAKKGLQRLKQTDLAKTS